jgi:hypothetical protein
MIRKMIWLGFSFSSDCKPVLVTGILAGAMMLSSASAQSTTSLSVTAPVPGALQAHASPSNSALVAATPVPVARPLTPSPSSRFRPNPLAGRAGRFYALFWGIDSPTVKAVEAGELIRFNYHVLDPQKAKAINDKKNDAYLVFPDAQIRLSVPSLEKVGQLRQSSEPEAGKTYWMAFSNPGRRVKRGDRVNVVIGLFHAEGLVVE